MKNFFELFSYTAFNFYYFPKKDGGSYERAIKGTIFMFAFFVVLLMIPFYVFSPLRDVINVKKYDLPPLGKVTLRYFLNGIWLLLVFLPVYYKCYKRGWRVLRIYAKYRHKDLGMYSWKWFFGAAGLAFIPLYLATLYVLGKLFN